MIPNDLFYIALHGICGKIHIESEDHRWTHLFDSKNIQFILNFHEIELNLDRLIENNPITNNLLQLLDQTLSRLTEISRKKGESNHEKIGQCCVGLYLCSLVIHHFSSKLPAQQLRMQFYLSPNWPFDYEQTAFCINISNSTISNSRIDILFDELAYTINSSHENMWMRDIKFFCLNLLLAFLSTQLYNDTSIGNTINSNYDKEDIFLSYLYRKAEFQLRVALGPSSAGNSKLFSDSLAVQLVRGLLIHCSYDCESCHSTGGSFLGASRGESSINSLLLSELLNRFGTKKYTTTQKPSDHIISMNTIKNLVLEWISPYLPFPSSDYLNFIHPYSSNSDIASNNKLNGNNLEENSMQLLQPHPLSSRCLGILLILLHNRRSSGVDKQQQQVNHQHGKKKPNPFREAFCLLYDQSLTSPPPPHATAAAVIVTSSSIDISNSYSSSNSNHTIINGTGTDDFYLCGDEEMNNNRSRSGSLSLLMILGTRIHIDFQQVISNLIKNLSNELYSLLLYSLLQAHPIFIEIVNTTAYLESLLASCLQILYNLTNKTKSQPTQYTSSKSIDQLYVIIVCILMIIQDSSVSHKLVEIHINAVPWYSERALNNIPLNNLVIVCLLKTITYAVRMNDSFVLSNAVAILFNIAPHVIDLLPYTAERLVNVVIQLCCRILSSNSSSNSLDSSPETNSVLSIAVTSVMQFFAILLRSKHIMLSNSQLLYALMREYEKVSNCFSRKEISQCIINGNISMNSNIDHQLPINILAITKYFHTIIELCIGERNSYCTTIEVIEIIQNKIQEYMQERNENICDTLTTGDTSEDIIHREKRTYQETENPEIFFVPIVWTNVLRCTPEIPWSLQYVQLIDPLSSGFLSSHQEELSQGNIVMEYIDNDASNQV